MQAVDKPGQSHLAFLHCGGVPDLVPDSYDDDSLRMQQGEEVVEVSVPLEMLAERARLQTFRKTGRGTGGAWQCGRTLAGHGFYRTRDGLAVKCAFCGLEVSGFSTAQDVMLWHRQVAAQDCPLLNGQHGAGTPELGTGRSVTAHSVSLARLSHPPATHARDPERYQPLRVAATGLALPDEPLESHSAFTSSLEVQRLAALPASRHAITATSEQATTQRKHHRNRSPATSRSHDQRIEAETTSPARNLPLSAPSTSVRTSTWADIIRTARYPEMAAFQSRLHTLKGWPLVKPSPRELARAGFFRETSHASSRQHDQPSPGSLSPLLCTETRRSPDPGPSLPPLPPPHCRRSCDVLAAQGGGDSVRCFWCGETIHRWRQSDDALLEHARLSPGCRYVTQILGEELHQDVVLAESCVVSSGHHYRWNRKERPLACSSSPAEQTHPHLHHFDPGDDGWSR